MTGKTLMFFLLLCCLPAGAAGGGRGTILLCATQSSMDQKTAGGMLDGLARELAAKGIKVLPSPAAGALAKNCCTDAACRKGAAGKLSATGYMKVELSQFGPLVRLKFHIYDTRRGKILVESEKIVRSKGKGDVLSRDVMASILSAWQEPAIGKEQGAAATAKVPVGMLAVETRPAGAELWIDGKRLGTAPLDARGPVGKHILVAKLAGYRQYEREVEITPSRRNKVLIEMTKKPVVKAAAEDAAKGKHEAVKTVSNMRAVPKPTVPGKVQMESPAEGMVVKKSQWPAPLGVLPVILWSAGAAGLVTGIVYGVKAKNHRDNANDPNFNGAQLEIDQGKTDQLVSNITIGIGAAAATAGFLVWLLDTGDEEPDASSVTPVVTSGGAVLTFSTSF